MPFRPLKCKFGVLGADFSITEKRSESPQPRGPNDQKIQSRSEFSIPIGIFNPDRKFQSRRIDFPTKIGPRWVARSKCSISLEIFNLARDLEFFLSLGPLGSQNSPDRGQSQKIRFSKSPGPRLKKIHWGQKRYSQEFVFPSFWRSSGELLVWFLTKALYFVCRRSELFRKFLGSLRMILCYWKTFSVPKFRRTLCFVVFPEKSRQNSGIFKGGGT